MTKINSLGFIYKGQNLGVCNDFDKIEYSRSSFYVLRFG